MKYESLEAFNAAQSESEQLICERLMEAINRGLPEADCKIWHGHPVWFLDGNPTVGYRKLKGCIRLMFWSGADFAEEKLRPGTGKFKDASIRYTDSAQIDDRDLQRWLGKSREIQWGYKNVSARKGRLERLV